jgi:itaconate CoA-transferase
MRPLDNLLVVSIEQAVAAPYCTRLLADLGARVIKIERPGIGDFARAYDDRVLGQSSYFVWANRSKESLTLDIKHARARELLARLVGRADVLVQNLAPGAAGRLGLSRQGLRADHPRLIICEISGFGLDGPCRDKKAYDLLVQAEAGLLSVTGTHDEMARCGISIADIAAAMSAYSQILAALILRSKTGAGCHIDVSMLEALAEWMGNPLYFAYAGAPQAERSGASHPSIYPYGPFRTGDGRTVFIGIQNEREWRVFCREVLKSPETAGDTRFDSNNRRSTNREQLRQLIEEKFAPLDTAAVMERLEHAKIAHTGVNQIADVWRHPQLRARQRWAEVRTPAGTIQALLPPGLNDGYQPRLDPVPALGEHTDAILGELGYTPDEIRSLHEENAV